MQDDQIAQSVDSIVSEGENNGASPQGQATQASQTFTLASNPAAATSQPQPDDVTAPQVDEPTPDQTEQPQIEEPQPSEPIASAPTETTEATEEPPKEEDSSGSTPQTNSNEDLSEIKRDAIAKLAPLVDELDQNPEEKYRTLMLLIQSTDDQSLIKEAYETADRIEDKKARAEALLGIINEIEYFTNNKK